MTRIDWLPVPVRSSHENTDVRPIKVEEHLLRNESGLVIKKRKKKEKLKLGHLLAHEASG